MDQRLNFENKMVFKVQSTLNDSVLVSNGKVTFEDYNKRCAHITPYLKELHWLPVHLRIHF